MTRAQYATLVAIAFNPFPKISAPDFTDVPKDFWAYSAIQIAASGGFVGGFSDVYDGRSCGTFRLDQNVQRLQVIVSLVNGLGLPAVDSDILEVYSDRHTIPDYAGKAVATYAIKNNICQLSRDQTAYTFMSGNTRRSCSNSLSGISRHWANICD